MFCYLYKFKAIAYNKIIENESIIPSYLLFCFSFLSSSRRRLIGKKLASAVVECFYVREKEKGQCLWILG